MKITIESTDKESIYSTSATVSVGHDDVEADQLLALLKQACLGYGYPPQTVSEMFDETDDK